MSKIVFAPGTEELLRRLDTPTELYGRNFPLKDGKWWYATTDEGPMSAGQATAYDTLIEALEEGSATDVAVNNVFDVGDHHSIPSATVYLTHANQTGHNFERLAERFIEWTRDNADNQYPGAFEEADYYLEKVTQDQIDRLQARIEPVMKAFFEEEKLRVPYWFDQTRRETKVEFTIDVRPGDEPKDDDLITVTSVEPVGRAWTEQTLRAYAAHVAALASPKTE